MEGRPSWTRLAAEALERGVCTPEALIEQYEPLLRSMVRRRLGSALFRAEGDDVLQMIRIAVFTALPSLRSKAPRSIAAWVGRIARSRILDWEKARRAARRSPSQAVLRLFDSGGLDVAAPTPTPSRILLTKERAEELRKAILAVPVRYRDLLLYIWEKEPSPEEVADFLGKEPEAARKFVARALGHLKQVLRRSYFRRTWTGQGSSMT